MKPETPEARAARAARLAPLFDQVNRAVSAHTSARARLLEAVEACEKASQRLADARALLEAQRIAEGDFE